MKATVPVFITGVSFPRKKPGGIDRAFVEMQDDSDCHNFKVAIRTEDAKKLQAALDELEEDESEDARGQITITYPSEEGASPEPETERAAIVRWLRREASLDRDTAKTALENAARFIERGDHLKP